MWICSSFCKNISAIMPDMGEPIAISLSGWLICSCKMK